MLPRDVPWGSDSVDGVFTARYELISKYNSEVVYRGSTISRNVCKYLPADTASHSTTIQSSLLQSLPDLHSSILCSAFMVW
jgi:hypothetical protein